MQMKADKKAADSATKDEYGDEYGEVMSRVTRGEVHLLTTEQRKNVTTQHRHMLVWAAFLGFASAACTAGSENVATLVTGVVDTGSAGLRDMDSDEPATIGAIQLFWALTKTTLIVCSIFEILFLYLKAIKHSMMVALAAGLKLTPLNRDRTHIAQTLVHAALEMNHHGNPVHGVDPSKESVKRAEFMMVLFVLLYKAKIALTGFALRILVRRMMSRDAAKFAGAWATLPATMAWNMLISHNVMKQAKLRSVGISASIELFDSVLREQEPEEKVDQLPEPEPEPEAESASTGQQELSPLFKLQLLRAIGAAIVRRRRLYPTQEVLLRHAVHALHMSSEVDETEGIVDDVETFLREMPKLPPVEQGKVLQVFVLASVLDGQFSKKEKRLYHELCDQCDARFQPHESWIRYFAQRFRNGQPVHYADLRQCVVWDDATHELGAQFYLSECAHWMFGLCSC